MEQAIKLAVEAGYKLLELKTVASGLSGFPTFAPYEMNLLQPDFWKCLGKALGWRNGMSVRYYRDRVGGIDWELDLENEVDISSWQYQWHLFIDHLAEGKDSETFFTELLANKQ